MRQRIDHVCGNDGRMDRGDWPCPQQEKHTLSPSGYTEWFEWADNMGKTHRQKRCPGCGRFAIWVPKAKASA